jgi:molybdenum cofactor cytidylyltransferase
MYGKLMAIEGDVGARNVIREHPQRVLTVEVDDPECVRDIDVPSDFEAFQKDPRL